MASPNQYICIINPEPKAQGLLQKSQRKDFKSQGTASFL